MQKIKKSLLGLSVIAAGAVAVSSCGPKFQEVEKDGYTLITQKGGRDIGYSKESGVQIITKNGYAFKDLNKNGKLDVYEDWRKPAKARAKDLGAQLSIEEVAGLMLYSAHQAVPGMGGARGSLYNGKTFEESGAKPYDLTDAQKAFLKDDNLRAVLVTTVQSPEVAARWNNNVQAFVEGLGHGIPANNSSDPRHSAVATAEYDEGAGGTISQWPSSLGMAASFDPALVEEFGRIAAKEYRALGIATALSPQIDLASEPRWSRFSGTFGDDPYLDRDLARAYVDGFQTSEGDKVIESGWGYESVNAMVKHWPSGGPEEGGRDAHYCYGKYSVWPGNNLSTHIIPFVDGAFKLNGPTGSASAVMPYYTISYNVNPSGENVGNNYSHYLIQELLRDKYGYEGVVCTDWNITHDNPAVNSFGGMCWGMETASVVERHFKVLEAGVDQFGGNNDKGPVLEAYQMWVDKYGEQSAKERFALSASRLLLNIFRTGLFENPYLDPAVSTEIVGNPEFMKAGYQAQLKSVVMLKNHNNTLPVAEKKKVYIPNRKPAASMNLFGLVAAQGQPKPVVDIELAGKYYQVVSNPSEADFALVFIDEPSSTSGYDVADVAKGGNGYVPISLQYNDYTATYAREVSIAGGDPKEDFTNRSYKGKTVTTRNKSDMQLVIDTKKLMGNKPVVVNVKVSRPMVFAEIEPYADAILLDFGVQNQAILETISGKNEPSGLLPMQMPADMKTVEEQLEDVCHDMISYKDADGHAYDFAFGLDWKGVINDSRVENYKLTSQLSMLTGKIIRVDLL